MNLRNLAIGQRLAIGLGAILLIAAALLTFALLSGARERTLIGQTIASTNERTSLAQQMHQALLRSAVVVRNMGLQTDVNGVNAAETAAKQARETYLGVRKKLEDAGLDDESKALLGQLSALDTQSEQHFKDAVGLAQQFNTEEAAAVIAKKIDPLTERTEAVLAKLAAAQVTRATAVQAEAQRRATQATAVVVVSGALCLALAVWIAWALSRSIVRPLRQAVDVAERVAHGDLTTVADVRGHDETAQLLRALNTMTHSLSRVVAEVRGSSEGIASGTSQIATGNADLSQRTESQASSLQQTAASMEELGATVKQNADNARAAATLAQDSSGLAARGGEVVAQVVDTMRGISESSRRIADIIGTIDGIAFQTNILALNAAVEAARAGEQGRGFAVVAGEVRNLAGRAGQAAKEIKGLINVSVERVEQGNSLVDQAGTTMGEIVGSIRRVSEIIGAISVASAQQSDGLSQVGESVTQMDRMTQQNAALVEESAAAAESLKRQAVQLVEAVSVFKLMPIGAAQ
jgi:methyl-accepting chemotaxis protein